MSKAVKRKITVELPKPRDLSKNRLSVFQRLGTKKPKSIVSESKSITDDLKQTLSAAVSITTKPILLPTPKADNVELEDADPDILEKKRAEIQKELELQLKMDSRKAAAKDAALRKRKRPMQSSSSSSSSSDSGSSSSSSSSSSSDERYKSRKLKAKRRDSSSSSDELRAKKLAKKRMCKKEALKLQKASHAKKLQMAAAKSKRCSLSPVSKKQRASTSSEVIINSKGQKVLVKTSKLSLEKHHRLREKELELRESEREKERLRLKERMRSRSPKPRLKSRSPKRLSRSREFSKQRLSSPHRRISPGKQRLGSAGRPIPVPRRADSRERRDKERQEREAAREKERREALARCQDRQRERERLAKEKTRRVDDKERLLPRPAERAMALAAARVRSRDSIEREERQARSAEKEHFNRSYSDRQGSYDDVRRHDRDTRELERDFVRSRGDVDTHDNARLRDSYNNDEKYDTHPRRDDRRAEYQSRGGYVDDQRQRSERDREWVHDDMKQRDTYERPVDRNQSRDWDHGHHTDVAHGSTRDNYNSREWSSTNESSQSWEKRQANTSWKSETKNWEHYKEDKWQDNKLPPQPPHQQPPHPHLQQKQLPIRNIVDKPDDHITPPGPKGIVSRRWNSWRGRRGGHHNSDFRRPIPHTQVHHQEIYEERGDVYRRHINPLGANTATDKHPGVRTPLLPKPAEPIVTGEKSIAEETNAEEIRDDLSEISDEADDILNCQEEQQEKLKSPKLAEITTINETTTTIVTTTSTTVVETLDTDKTKTDFVEKIESPATPAETKPEEIATIKEITDDIDLDFEEISDGELEEEARVKGLGDALGVDWASLVEESKAITREKTSRIETSGKQRWQSHRIFLDVGISFKMAGKDFAMKLLKNAHQKLVEESKEMKVDVKHEPEKEIKQEKPDEPEELDEQIVIKKEVVPDNEVQSDVAMVKVEADDVKSSIEDAQIPALACAQVATRINAYKQYNVVFNATGPYSRGLCAKRDIAMRRQLCNLPIAEKNCKNLIGKQSTGFESLAVKLFQKAVGATQ